MASPICLQALELDIKPMMAAHPPVWRHGHKRAVYEKVVQNCGHPEGRLRYTRWEAARLPATWEPRACDLVAKPDFYSYEASAAHVWHVNFADPRLFAAYGSALLAQDELQVLEHPALGSLREALLAADDRLLTRENTESTPVLISGVPRQCALDTAPTRRPKSLWSRLTGETEARGLYGNQFQKATLGEVMAALTFFRPPTVTNIIAMAAPTGRGLYKRSQIIDVVETAYTAMCAAALESSSLSPSCGVEINTGWWGCGAFGGNRTLMALLQVLAARMAGVGRLVFHTGSKASIFEFDEGCGFLEAMLADCGGNTSTLMDAIERVGFSWGTSDGN